MSREEFMSCIVIPFVFIAGMVIGFAIAEDMHDKQQKTSESWILDSKPCLVIPDDKFLYHPVPMPTADGGTLLVDEMGFLRVKIGGGE